MASFTDLQDLSFLTPHDRYPAGESGLTSLFAGFQSGKKAAQENSAKRETANTGLAGAQAAMQAAADAGIIPREASDSANKAQPAKRSFMQDWAKGFLGTKAEIAAAEDPLFDLRRQAAENANAKAGLDILSKQTELETEKRTIEETAEAMEGYKILSGLVGQAAQAGNSSDPGTIARFFRISAQYPKLATDPQLRQQVKTLFDQLGVSAAAEKLAEEISPSSPPPRIEDVPGGGKLWQDRKTGDWHNLGSSGVPGFSINQLGQPIVQIGPDGKPTGDSIIPTGPRTVAITPPESAGPRQTTLPDGSIATEMRRGVWHVKDVKTKEVTVATRAGLLAHRNAAEAKAAGEFDPRARAVYERQVGQWDTLLNEITPKSQPSRGKSIQGAPAGLQKITSQSQFDALNSGDEYIGRDGNRYRKP